MGTFEQNGQKSQNFSQNPQKNELFQKIHKTQNFPQNQNFQKMQKKMQQKIVEMDEFEDEKFLLESEICDDDGWSGGENVDVFGGFGGFGTFGNSGNVGQASHVRNQGQSGYGSGAGSGSGFLNSMNVGSLGNQNLLSILDSGNDLGGTDMGSETGMGESLLGKRSYMGYQSYNLNHRGIESNLLRDKTNYSIGNQNAQPQPYNPNPGLKKKLHKYQPKFSDKNLRLPPPSIPHEKKNFMEKKFGYPPLKKVFMGKTFTPLLTPQVERMDFSETKILDSKYSDFLKKNCILGPDGDGMGNSSNLNTINKFNNL